MIQKILQTSGKRKRATARATVRPGTGMVSVNKIPLSQIQPHFVQLKISEPMIIADEIAKAVDVDVLVCGGGISGQANACRIAISRALVNYSNSDDLRSKFLTYDRHMLVNDVRHKEKAKPNCHGKARAKVQKSYR